MSFFDRLLQNAGRQGLGYLDDQRAREQQEEETRRRRESDMLQRALMQLELSTNPRLRDVTGVPEAPRPSVFEGARFAPNGGPARGAPRSSAPSIFQGQALGLPGSGRPEASLARGGSRDSATGPLGLEEPGIAPVGSREAEGSLLKRWEGVTPRRPRVDVQGRTYEVQPEQTWSPERDPELLRKAVLAANPERYGVAQPKPNRLEGAGGRLFDDTPEGLEDWEVWEREHNPARYREPRYSQSGEEKPRMTFSQALNYVRSTYTIPTEDGPGWEPLLTPDQELDYAERVVNGENLPPPPTGRPGSPGPDSAFGADELPPVGTRVPRDPRRGLSAPLHSLPPTRAQAPRGRRQPDAQLAEAQALWDELAAELRALGRDPELELDPRPL